MGISTHILDVARGKPAVGVPVRLYDRADIVIGEGTTDTDGRVKGLLVEGLKAGRYRVHFETSAYFATQGIAGLYPYVDIVFTAAPGEAHYHIPLLLTANGYSTYRGS
ncbi:MAG: hydroxyisourate hydrolase [Clostridia bacterium]|nr:hydroxyisourate hydrolase [Deltaproteobacteria bacterium]